MTYDDEETRIEELRRKAKRYGAEKEEDDADDWSDKWDQKNNFILLSDALKAVGQICAKNSIFNTQHLRSSFF